jgi:antitoxin VapB
MVPSIKDPEADRLARLTGESITESVKMALRDRVEREQRRRGERIDRAKIAETVAGIAGLPVVDARSPDDLIGYDDRGLPRDDRGRFRTDRDRLE